jgi:hypothetical protein
MQRTQSNSLSTLTTIIPIVANKVKNTNRELFVWTVDDIENLDKIKNIKGIDYFISNIKL